MAGNGAIKADQESLLTRRQCGFPCISRSMAMHLAGMPVAQYRQGNVPAPRRTIGSTGSGAALRLSRLHQAIEGAGIQAGGFATLALAAPEQTQTIKELISFVQVKGGAIPKTRWIGLPGQLLVTC